MKLKYILPTLLAALVLACPAWAQPSKEAPSKAKLGERVPNLAFVGEKSQKFALHDLKDKKAVVIVFFSFECPVSNSYCQPLVEMQKEFEKSGVAFLGLTVNPDETPAQVAKLSRDFSLNFPVYRDTNLVAAKALEAEVTPECFVLDSDFNLRYRGRIDDTWSARLKKHGKVTQHDLKQVLGEILSGRPVAEPATKAIGCPVPRDLTPSAKTGDVTYYKDVLPILQTNCQTCHRPGEVGPFSLMTYKQAVNWADDIKTYTRDRTMPPWKLVGGVPMHGERRLTDKEIDTLAAWADGGTPQGDPKDAPPARKFTDGWQLGTPDLVLSPSDDIVLGPTGKDWFRCFVMPTNLPEDVYVSAVELRPGNPRIVHHLLLYIDTTGKGRKLEEAEKARKDTKTETRADDPHPAPKANPDWDKGPGYSSTMGIGFVPSGGLGGWSPGITPHHLPTGTGFYLPKNSDVIMQVHYHRNGRLEKDKTQIGLYFSKKPVEQNYVSGVVAGGQGKGAYRHFFSLPPGDDNVKLDGDGHVTRDFTLYSISPHMHMLGKKISVDLVEPDGASKKVLAIDDWDYNWQEVYFLKEPIHVKKGSRLHVDAAYDNSAKNPMNPFSPPRRITFGEQTFNEMCFVFFGGTAAPEPGTLTRARRLPISREPVAVKKAD